MLKRLMKGIKNVFRLIARKFYGHNLDCCGHITYRCKTCPFNTKEVKEIVKRQKEKEHKGYFTITGGKL